MNSYQLISRLKKVRADTYLTAIEQALFHELVSACNEKGWKDTFDIKNIQLCSSLNITEKTLIKSRKTLLDAGLVYFQSCKDKRIGCYYSFSPILLPVLSPVTITVENTGDIKETDSDIRVLSPVLSTLLFAGIIPGEKNRSTVLSTVIFPVEVPILPYKRIKTINKESSHPPMREEPPSDKPKISRKKEGDAKPLVYPFTSDAFMSAWEMLRNTPKWKKKLNYALQLSLDKLSRFEEEFAIRQIERAIESDWVGVVFTGTERDYQEWLIQKYGNNKINQRNNSGDKPKTAGIKSISF
ncbi:MULTISPECIES: hypothetical protein [unclassified Bacteroides]|jgi:hypothetical protein|uniref:hypothetical protein n=1 Tax=unclassified Bacteroides TaxID=2646097 RepID=UPI0018F627C3|nr:MULTISPECIES: hypothetical protein [unclassified Bacteroides]